jgi:hypothetical protein
VLLRDVFLRCGCIHAWLLTKLVQPLPPHG